MLAPHILVEDISVDSIRKAREAYLGTDLKQRLGRYHEDADSAFFGWNDVWLSPAFRTWSIEEDIRAIRCPLLAMQGLDDEYGTLEQMPEGVVFRRQTTSLQWMSHLFVAAGFQKWGMTSATVAITRLSRGSMRRLALRRGNSARISPSPDTPPG